MRKSKRLRQDIPGAGEIFVIMIRHLNFTSYWDIDSDSGSLYRDIFRPLLQMSDLVFMKEYTRDWLKNCPEYLIPGWAYEINDLVEFDGKSKDFFMRKDVALDTGEHPLWYFHDSK